MDEEDLDLGYLYPDFHLNQATLDRIDRALLAVAGRVWEVTGDTTPQAHQGAQTTWPVEEMRTSRLGQCLLLIVEYASGGYAADPPQVERAMKQVLRTLYGDPLGDGVAVPEQFHKTDLGQLFDEAQRRIQGREGLMTPAQVYHELGVARTTLYDRVKRKQLHPVYTPYGEMRLLRSEVEAWKAQRRQHKTERMDESMAAQENVALARSLLELYNSRQSDPAWLDKSGAAFAADCEVIDVPSGTTLHGPDGYKRLVRFFAEAFPDSRTKLTNAFATEDQVTLEFTSRGTNIGLLHLPSQAIPATGRSFELRLCEVMQIRNGKIVRFHTYYDMMTLLEQLGLNSATR